MNALEKPGSPTHPHPFKPLAAHANSKIFKVYFADCGLLSRTARFTFEDLRSNTPETG